MFSRSDYQLKQTLLVAIALTTLLAQSDSSASTDPAPPLLAISKVRALSRAEMARLDDVRIRGSIAFINNEWKVLFVYQDGESVKVGFDVDLQVSVGTPVEIKGQVVLGDVGPVIVATDLQELHINDPGEEFAPVPIKIDQTTPFSASLVDQWVEFEGPAYSAVADNKHSYVSLAGKMFGVYAIIPNSDELPPLEILREAPLRIRGIPSISVQPGAEGQIDFLIPNASNVEILKTADEIIDPKPRRIAEIGRVDMRGTSEAPARIRAVVRCVSQSGKLFIADETGSLMVEMNPEISVGELATGNVIEVEGFVVRNRKHEYITDAKFRYIGKGFSLHPEQVTAAKAVKHPAELIELDGTLISRSDGNSSLLMKNGMQSFRVLANDELSKYLNQWSVGSRFRLTGCTWFSKELDTTFEFYPNTASVIFGLPAEESPESSTESAVTNPVENSMPQSGSSFYGVLFTHGPQFVWLALQVAFVLTAVTIAWQLHRRLKTQEKFHKSIHEQLSNLSHIARLNTLAEMVGALAHELNQPLASVSNYAAAAELLSRKEPADPEKLNNVLINIGQEAFRAGEIIRRLRHLVRKKTPGSLPIQLSEIISETVELFKTQHVTASGLVQVDIPDNLPAVQADSVQIQQVILNLLLNARDATETLTDRPPTIQIKAALEAGMVSVSVSDNGIGINSSNPDAIFEPYFTTREEGTGLGLAISRTIIETHGGKITAENQTPHGTRITFSLPVSGTLSNIVG